MHETSHVSLKVEPRSTSRLSLTLNSPRSDDRKCVCASQAKHLISRLYFIYVIKIYVRVHARKNYATVEIHPNGANLPRVDLDIG